MRSIIVSAFLPAMICIVSCGTARRSEPIMGPLPALSEKVETGRMVFNDKCNKCHPGGEGGMGPMINNVYLPEFMLKFRVRSQGFALWVGKMPSFKKHEISRRELDALTAYLKVLRKNDKDTYGDRRARN